MSSHIGSLASCIEQLIATPLQNSYALPKDKETPLAQLLHQIHQLPEDGPTPLRI